MQKEIHYIYYRCKIQNNRKSEFKALSDEITKQVINEQFTRLYIPRNYNKVNRYVTKKIINILISNCIYAVKNNRTDILISLDKTILLKHKLPLKLFKAVIDRLIAMDKITMKKGYFNTDKNIHIRSRLTLNDNFKKDIYEKIIHPTFNVDCKLVESRFEKIKDEETIKLVFQDAETKRYSVFVKKDCKLIKELFEHKNNGYNVRTFVYSIRLYADGNANKIEKITIKDK